MAILKALIVERTVDFKVSLSLALLIHSDEPFGFLHLFFLFSLPPLIIAQSSMSIRVHRKCKRLHGNIEGKVRFWEQ